MVDELTARRFDRVFSVAGLIAVPAIAMAGVTLLAPVPGFGERFADVGVYFVRLTPLLNGAVPYRDLPLEYPPMALLPLGLPLLGLDAAAPEYNAYAARFAIMNMILVIAVGGLIVGARWPSEPMQRLAAYLPVAVALTPLLVWRFDVFPALLSLLSFVFVLGGRPVLAGLSLAASILAKLYAFPLAVAYLLWLLLRGERRSAVAFAAAVAIPLIVLAIALVAVPGLQPSFLTYQLDRGIQVESLFGGIAAIGRLAGVPAEVVDGYGSYEIQSPMTPALKSVAQIAFPVLLVAVLVIGGIGLWRTATAGEPLRGSWLAALTMALLLAVIVPNKVLSPQYLVWLLPFVAFTPIGPRLLIVASALLTMWLYPFLFEALAQGEVLPIIVLNVRNVLLVVALAWLVARMLRVRSSLPE